MVYFCFLRLGVSQKALRHLGQVNGLTSLFLGHQTYSQRSHLKPLIVATPTDNFDTIHFISITLIQYLYMYSSKCNTI